MNLKDLIKTPRDEDDFLRLIFTGITESVDSNESESDNVISAVTFLQKLGASRINKICFSVADELNSAVTRSWYIFGTHIEKDLSNLLLEKEPFQNIINPNIKAEYKNILPHLEMFINEYKALSLNIPVHSLMRKLYQQKSPREYRELYLRNLDLLDVFAKMTKITQNPNKVGLLSRDFSIKSRAFIKTYLDLEDKFEKYQNPLMEYLVLAEELFIKHDELVSNNVEITPEILSLWKTVEKGYKFNFWVMPACEISIDTMVGLRKSEESDSKREEANNNFAKSSVNFERVNESCMNANLLMSQKNIVSRLTECKYGSDLSKIFEIYQGCS